MNKRLKILGQKAYNSTENKTKHFVALVKKDIKPLPNELNLTPAWVPFNQISKLIFTKIKTETIKMKLIQV